MDASLPADHPLVLARAIREAKAQRAKRSALFKHIFLIAASLVMTYPLLWMLASSFKPNNQIFGDPSLWPREFTWANYPGGWNGMAVSFGTFVRNSLFVTILSVIGNVLSCSFTA